MQDPTDIHAALDDAETRAISAECDGGWHLDETYEHGVAAALRWVLGDGEYPLLPGAAADAD